MPLSVLHVPKADLYTSQPDPRLFGNPRNAPGTDVNWLKSHFHFSFAEYRNPKNTQFGVLRVLNDDLVQAQRGFGMHGHRDVEIMTYVASGVLTHKDSMGTDESLGRGSVQFMTAGTGVLHSEHNLEEDSPLRMVQIWINTRQNGLEPRYGGHDGTTATARAARKNKLHQLVADARAAEKAPIKIEQDCRMYVSELEPEQLVSLPLAAGRQAYLLCVEGAVTLSDAGASGVALQRHDAAEIRGDGEIRVAAGAEPAHVLLLEMAAGPGGRGPGKWPMHIASSA